MTTCRDHSGIPSDPWGHSKWVNNTNVHSKFTLISLFSKIHSLKSEHIHSFLFREYNIYSGAKFYSSHERFQGSKAEPQVGDDQDNYLLLEIVPLDAIIIAALVMSVKKNMYDRKVIMACKNMNSCSFWKGMHLNE